MKKYVEKKISVNQRSSAFISVLKKIRKKKNQRNQRKISVYQRLKK